MAGVVDVLNYNFNFQLYKFNLYIRDRLCEKDRRLAVAWVNKLKSEVQTIEEAQLRNDVLFYLVTCVEEGCLKPPFHQTPPHGTLINLKNIMPASLKYSLEKPSPKPRPEIFERSPDKGAFLASQPVPRSGAFCYLAIHKQYPPFFRPYDHAETIQTNVCIDCQHCVCRSHVCADLRSAAMCLYRVCVL